MCGYISGCGGAVLCSGYVQLYSTMIHLSLCVYDNKTLNSVLMTKISSNCHKENKVFHDHQPDHPCTRKKTAYNTEVCYLLLACRFYQLVSIECRETFCCVFASIVPIYIIQTNPISRWCAGFSSHCKCQ